MGKKKESKKGRKAAEAQAEQDYWQGVAQRYLDVVQRQHQHGQPQRLGPHSTILFEMQFDAMSAQSLAAAIHYMDDELLEEDEEAMRIADLFFREVCRRAVDLFLPVLAQSGVQTAPEIWQAGYQRVAAALGFGGDEEEEGEDEE